jgi:hypothetical protein
MVEMLPSNKSLGQVTIPLKPATDANITRIFLVLQLSFATKIQLHVTHVTTNLCSCIRQVAHDIQLHATLRMQHVYTMLIYMFI